MILDEAGAREATQVVVRIADGERHRLRASFGVALGGGAPDPEALLQAGEASASPWSPALDRVLGSALLWT